MLLKDLWTISISLKTILCETGSQCSSFKIGVIWHDFVDEVTTRAAVFCMRWRRDIWFCGRPWFTVYTSPFRDIILKYNLNYHVYADDTQLYITFKSSQETADSCITMLEKCIQEIRSWMRQNFLKLNDENTKFLLFGSCQQLSKVSLPFITVGDSEITPSSQARNLGVIFDSTMTLKKTSYLQHCSRIIISYAE